MRITLPNPKRFSKVFESITNIPLKQTVTGICTDSRQCIDGDLYIALMGNKVDGHDYINDAKRLGAIAALTSKKLNNISDLQIISVENVITTIGDTANKWRKQYDIPVIGITGSNGKTTTKDLVKHILSSKYNVHFTKGNFNTSIGLPLNLLLLESIHDISVVEMGANQSGDIKLLCQIAEPSDGLITNIGPAHLERFGSIENVLAEKSELFKYLSNGRIFKNVSDNYIVTIPSPSNTIEYGCEANCDFTADYYREKDGNIILIINANELNLKSQSLVFAKNVLAAAVIANTFGIDWKTIQSQIVVFTPTYGRTVISKHGQVTVIDDTYNANYNSTVAALENLIQIADAGRKIFVFGDMGELGSHSKEYHQKIGKKCINFKIDTVYTIGIETKNTDRVLDGNINHKHFSSADSLVEELSNYIKNGDTVLFKGSRSMEIEKIIQEVFKK